MQIIPMKIEYSILKEISFSFVIERKTFIFSFWATVTTKHNAIYGIYSICYKGRLQALFFLILCFPTINMRQTYIKYEVCPVMVYTIELVNDM